MSELNFDGIFALVRRAEAMTVEEEKAFRAGVAGEEFNIEHQMFLAALDRTKSRRDDNARSSRLVDLDEIVTRELTLEITSISDAGEKWGDAGFLVTLAYKGHLWLEFPSVTEGGPTPTIAFRNAYNLMMKQIQATEKAAQEEISRRRT